MKFSHIIAYTLTVQKSLTLTIYTGEGTSRPVETAITKAAFECSILLSDLDTGKCGE